MDNQQWEGIGEGIRPSMEEEAIKGHILNFQIREGECVLELTTPKAETTTHHDNLAGAGVTVDTVAK